MRVAGGRGGYGRTVLAAQEEPTRPPCVEGRGRRAWVVRDRLLVTAVVVSIAVSSAHSATATATPKLPQQYLAGVNTCNRWRLQV